MAEMTRKEERLWAMLCHFGIFAGHFIPLGNIIAPLVIWLLKKNDSEYVDYHGKESLNFQLTVLIYLVISIILAFVLIGFVLAIGLWVFSLVFVVIAGIRASEGVWYRYPLTIRFIK